MAHLTLTCCPGLLSSHVLPPCCSEGILWHVLTTPMKISQTLLTRYLQAVGDLSCPSGEIRRGSLRPNVEMEAGNAVAAASRTRGE